MRKITSLGDLTELEREAFATFNDALDYFWKTPEFLDLQEEIEVAKLEDYPEGRIREFRWEHESRRIYRLFPVLMAWGNVFTAAAVYETFVHRLVKEVEAHHGGPLDEVSGDGLSRLFSYLRRHDIRPEQADCWDQVQAFLKIRHCLMHAAGFLENFRDAQEIERIARSGTYLDRGHRDHRKGPDGAAMVEVIDSELGRKLQVRNQYAWLATAYLRDHFMEVSATVSQEAVRGGATGRNGS